MQNGQTALSIAQRLGYISVVETLKVVTEQEVTTTTTTTVEEKYRVNAPESMQETFMSDSEDEGGKSVCRKGARYPLFRWRSQLLSAPKNVVIQKNPPVLRV